MLNYYLQILSVLMYVNIFMILPFISIILTGFYVLNVNYMGHVLLGLYFVFAYIESIKHFATGNSNGWMFLRNNYMTDLLRGYFPIELIKTAELEPIRNYVFVSFPHGIACTGITNNMGNNIARFLKLFPGIRPKLATLNMFFHIPLCREVFGSLGFVSCSEESLKYYLTNSNDSKHKNNRDGFTSNAVSIMVGGIRESFDSQPRRYILTLKNRKGFVKIAIKTGSFIVPTFSFGEVDIFDQTKDLPPILLQKFQTIAMIWNVFSHSLQCLPKRKPIVQVVGAAIEVKQMSHPSAEYVDEIHQKVINNLYEIFDKYKHKYIANADSVNLVIN